MAKPKGSAVRAVQKIERSQLNKAKVQRELMGNELPLKDIVVYLKSKIQFETTDRVIDIVVQRDIDAASTVVVTLNDYDRTILQSRRLHNALDIQLDGMWFRLVKVERSSGADELQLTFEQREIAVLRSYPKKGAPHNGVIFADRANISRAQFVLRLIREVKEISIPVVIPDLHQIQQIEKKADAGSTGIDWSSVASDMGVTLSGDATATSTTGGIPLDYNQMSADDRNTSPQRAQSQNSRRLTVQGSVASKEQIRNVNIVVSVGQNMGAARKVIVCAIMTIIQESWCKNLSSGDGTSVGLFQQTSNGAWGSFQDRHDPATAARMFYKQAIEYNKNYPGAAYWLLCADIQRPKESLRTLYGKWWTEANKFVTAYGIPGGDNETSAADANLMGSAGGIGQGSEFFYYRGTPAEQSKVWKREDSWTCIRRLADEVGWRAFFVSGVFYFINDEDLFKTQPIMIFDESTPGIEGVGFDIDIGKKTSEISVDARTGRWLAPPGAVVLAKNLGPANGRWLVHQFERSIFDSKASITCAKPQAQLPEPLDDQIELPGWANVGMKVTNQQQSTAAGVFIWPLVPRGTVQGTPGVGTHSWNADPTNWESDNAWDIYVAAGSKVIAVADGTIGPEFGPLASEDPRMAGIRIHLVTANNEFYYAHLRSTFPGIGPGVKVKQGDILGASGVANGVAHLHIGVKKPYNPPIAPPLPFGRKYQFPGGTADPNDNYHHRD